MARIILEALLQESNGIYLRIIPRINIDIEIISIMFQKSNIKFLIRALKVFFSFNKYYKIRGYLIIFLNLKRKSQKYTFRNSSTVNVATQIVSTTSGIEMTKPCDVVGSAS